MTLFLIVTGLMNIALGYGLAIYLGKATWPARAAAAVELPAEADAEESHVAEVATTPVAAPTAPAGLPIEPIAATAAAAASPTTAVEPAGAELEQEVLAGIQEFRNQLAQMKALQGGAETPVEAAVAASV